MIMAEMLLFPPEDFTDTRLMMGDREMINWGRLFSEGINLFCFPDYLWGEKRPLTKT